MNTVLSTDFLQAIRARPAKWLAAVTCRSDRTVEGWRAGMQPGLLDAIKLAKACPRIAAALNRWADRMEAAVAIERAALEKQQLELDLALAEHRARRS